jgi:hypothetical protein
MHIKTSSWLKPATQRVSVIAMAFAMGSFPLSASAQSDAIISDQYPQLAELFNAFDVTQANAFDKIQEINSDPSTHQARNKLAMELDMAANTPMSMSHGGHGGMDMDMDMGSGAPYADLEVAARVELMDIMRASYSGETSEMAFNESDAIDRHTAEVLKRGRSFETNLFAIYIDDSISDKRAAVQNAIEEYLTDDQHAVATFPKDSRYLLDHDQATGFTSAFPLLSGFLWTQQWLQLAALESVILEELDDQFANGHTIALERFWNKIGSSGGMSMFPAPSELPMSPAIAPNLYSQSQQAAIILDNLNVLETVILDILSYPNVENREELMAEVVLNFTDKSTDTAETMDYLLFALRGGIYDQGGPAVGELMQSERNRSRDEMGMQHSMIMSVQ